MKTWNNLLVLSIMIFVLMTPLHGATTVQTTNVSKNDGEINIYKIWFNWGLESGAVTLKDCDKKETPLSTPEFDTTYGRNNPAAYVKGNNFTVKVKFTSEDVSTASIKATGTFGGLPEKQVTFYNVESDWITFTTNEAIPNLIKTHNVEWEWLYYDSDTETWVNIGNTSHTVYALNRKPLTDEVFENLSRWTTKWCESLPFEDQEDDKKIADAILNGFANDGVIQYGGRGWDTAEILRTGDGMCGGMSRVFFDACATQGVKVIGFSFHLLDTSLFDPQALWRGIVCQDPGLGRTEPGFASIEIIWKWVNETYPYPAYYGSGNENDDVDEQFTRAYIFYKFDGHVVNLLDYNGEILLYDLSFGKGPYMDTFSSIPQQGRYTSSQIKNFRENYHDIAIDHMNGRIYYKNSAGKVVLDQTDFSVKTSIIPDEIDGNNQLLYLFYTIDYRRSSSKPTIVDNDHEYREFFKGILEKPENFKISFKEKNLIEGWLENPSVEIDWLELRNAILKLGNSKGYRERIYAKNLLNRVLKVKTEINVPEEFSLPGLMSPLNMVKAAAIASLEFLDSSESIADKQGAKNKWSTLEASMPRNKQYINTPFQWFLQQHLNLFPILQMLLQRLELQ